jgi:hypothetical protein
MQLCASLSMLFLLMNDVWLLIVRYEIAGRSDLELRRGLLSKSPV